MSREVRDLLNEIIERVERLEKLLERERMTSEALAMALTILMMGNKTVELAEAARRLAWAHQLSASVKGELARSILEVLAVKGPLNISGLTIELRKRRGRASRRIVSRVVDSLAREGLLRVEKRGKEKIVDIAQC